MEYYGFVIGEQEPTRQHAETLEHLLDLAVVAEAGGFDGWFFAEHHGQPEFSTVSAPNLLVAAASQLTTRMRLGVLVTVLPYHHPLRAAEEIRMLDNLCNGRLDIGFGRGAIRHEQAAYGIDRQRTAEIFDAQLQIVLDLLRNGSGKWDTEWWTGSIEALTPEAVQTPYPPMWMATVSSNSITRAATLGAHAATTLLPLDTAMQYRANYHAEWQRLRPTETVGKFSHGVTIAVAETREEAKKYAYEALSERADRFLAQISDRPTGNDAAYADHERGWKEFVNSSFNDMIDRGLIIYGSVEDATQQLARIVEAAPEALTVSPQFSGLDHDFGRRSLELFANEVVPAADPQLVASTL